MLTSKINKKDKDLVFVYTTCKDHEEAKSIAFQSINNERLAVCADFWPINSIYPWQNVVEEVTQYMIVFTTQKVLSDRLMKFIEGTHSYAVPVIIKSGTQLTTQDYKFWVETTLENSEPYITKEEFLYKKRIAEEGVYHPDQLK